MTSEEFKKSNEEKIKNAIKNSSNKNSINNKIKNDITSKTNKLSLCESEEKTIKKELDELNKELNNSEKNIKDRETLLKNAHEERKKCLSEINKSFKSNDVYERMKINEYIGFPNCLTGNGGSTIGNPKRGSKLWHINYKIKVNEKAIKEINDKFDKETKEKKERKKKLEEKLKNKEKECEAISKELDGLKFSIIDYDEKDIADLSSYLDYSDYKQNNYNLGNKRAEKKGSKSNLLDMRNLNGKNFRKTGFDTNKFNKAFENNTKFSPSKSYYMNIDYLFSNSLAVPPLLGRPNNKDFPEVQRLIINEFQPYNMMQISEVFGKMANGIGNMVGKVASSIGSFLIVPATNSVINKMIDYASEHGLPGIGTKNARDRKFISSDPVQQVQNMFNGGKWLNTYEIPFYGNEYLAGENNSYWSLGGAHESIGGISSITDLMGIDFPSNPKFKIGMKEAATKQISSEFYLINANKKWLKRNFEFIHAIFAGTSWLHLKYSVIRPPNVYNVLCPGRFNMVWAGMECKVEFVGKLRKNEKVSEDFKKMGILSIDKDMLWPDAWKITLTIKDFTPNNFNMYANYYLNGFNPDEIVELDQQRDIKNIFTDFKNYFKEIASDITSGAMEYFNDEKSMNDYKGNLNELKEMSIPTSIFKHSEIKNDNINSFLENEKAEQEAERKRAEENPNFPAS